MVQLVSRSMVGLALGIGSVGVGSYVIESTFPIPEFKPDGDRYDSCTNKFLGRYVKMITNSDPFTLIKTEKQIREAQKLLKRFEADQLSENSCEQEYTNKELWDAQKLVSAAVHPDTGKVIPRPFRMSGYAAFNGPICVAMMASTSTPALLFWNWVNQSQNALVNYSNRNASSPTSNEILLKSYGAAVVSAMAVAFGMSQVIRTRFAPKTASKLLKFVAFPSSVIASCSNCYIMRSSEISKGIVVSDDEGNVLAGGKRSIVAAQKAVQETVLSRAFLQIPVFFGTAAIMSLPRIVTITAAHPASVIPMTTFVTMIMFGYGLPAAVAIFPQVGSLETSDLEESLQNEIKFLSVRYNKGL